MKPVAIFVEGQTEAIFVEWVIQQIADVRGAKVAIRLGPPVTGKHHAARRMSEIEIMAVPPLTARQMFYIFNCGSDVSAQSDMVDTVREKRDVQYSLLLCLRDVYQKGKGRKPSDAVKITRSCEKALAHISSSAVPRRMIFAIMETEAWFIADETHYAKVNQSLSLAIANIEARKCVPCIDVSRCPTEALQHPAETLDAIYRHVGLVWNKNDDTVRRTVTALSFDNVLKNVPHNARCRNPSLNALVSCIEGLI